MAIHANIDHKTRGIINKVRRRPALENVHFTLEEGTATLLIGSSGCGKSTLVNCLTNRTCFAGKVQTEQKLKLAYIPQNSCLNPEETAFRAVFYSARMANPQLSNAELRETAMGCLTEMGIAGKAHKRVGSLSGGQKQRVAIASELVRNANFIIADELDTGLDYAVAQNLAEIIQRIAHEQGATALVISHNCSTVKYYDNLMVLARRKSGSAGIAYFGPASEAPEFFDGIRDFGEILELINDPEEGGYGMGETYIRKYEQCTGFDDPQSEKESVQDSGFRFQWASRNPA